MSDTAIARELKSLREEMRALREVVCASAPAKRIEPDAVYTVDQAAKLLGKGNSAKTLRRKLNAYIIVGKRTSPRAPWMVRGAELLRLGGRAQS